MNPYGVTRGSEFFAAPFSFYIFPASATVCVRIAYANRTFRLITFRLILQPSPGLSASGLPESPAAAENRRRQEDVPAARKRDIFPPVRDGVAHDNAAKPSER